MTRWMIGCRAALLAAGLCACSGAAEQQRRDRVARKGKRQDVEYRKKLVFTLQRNDDGTYELSSETEVTITLLSDRSTRRATYAVWESFFAPMSGLEASRNGDGLSSDQIVETVPGGRGHIFLDDDKAHLLKFKTVKVGDTLRWRHRNAYIDPGWLPFVRVPNRDRVQRFELVINHPPGVKVEFKQFYPRRRFEPRVRRGPTRSSLVFGELPHPQPLDQLPGGYNRWHAVIWPQLRDARGQAIAPITVREFVEWRASHFKPFEPFSAAQRALIKGLVEGATSPRERARRVYDWVRGNVRYIADERGINGFVPRAPSLVMKRRYGDCKDVSYLVIHMAREAGVSMTPVEVGTSPDAPFEGAHNAMTDHLVATFMDGGKRVFLDPTCDHCEYGNLPEMDVEKVALILDPEAPQKLTIPAPEQGPSVEVAIEAALGQLDRGTARIVLRNAKARRARELKRTRKGDDLQTGLSRLLGGDLTKILLEELEFVSVADDHVELRARAGLDQFVVQSSRRVYLPRGPFRTQGAKVLERAGDPHDIFLTWRDHLKLTVALQAPGYVVSDGEPTRLAVDGVGEFRARLEHADGKAAATYYYRLDRKHYPAAKKRALLRFHDQFLGTRKRMFALKKNGSSIR